jgi:hypothetical protein
MVINRTIKHDVIERGQALYEASIRPLVEPQHNGKFLVMDVESGEYEIDANMLAALDRLRLNRPGAEPYVVRVGHPTAVTLSSSRVIAR